MQEICSKTGWISYSCLTKVVVLLFIYVNHGDWLSYRHGSLGFKQRWELYRTLTMGNGFLTHINSESTKDAYYIALSRSWAMLWLMLFHGGGRCDGETRTWDTKKDCSAKENHWTLEHHSLHKVEIYGKKCKCVSARAWDVPREISANSKKEKERSFRIPLVFQMTPVTSPAENNLKIVFELRYHINIG